MHDQAQVIAVKNTPIFVDGRAARLLLEWKEPQQRYPSL